MRFERIEVAVAVQQPQAIGQASRCDDQVNSATDRDSMSTQLAEILRGCNGKFFAAQGDLGQSRQHAARFVEATIVFESTQHFREDQVADHQTLDTDRAALKLCLTRVCRTPRGYDGVYKGVS